MDTTATTPRPSQPHARTHAQCCTEPACVCGLRNNYYLGKRLTADSFRVEQSYLIGRRRLLNRALYGWGVVYGYRVGETPPAPGDHGAASGRLTVGSGLALDEAGRELLQPEGTSLAFGDVIVLDRSGTRACKPEEHPDRTDEDHENEHWLLCVHYAEQSIAPVTLPDPCSCERKEWDHVCETVRFSLRRIRREDCCRPELCELDCGCGKGMCCEEARRASMPHDDDRDIAQRAEEQAAEPGWDGSAEHGMHEDHGPGARRHTPNPVARGGCECLCHHLAGLDITDECGALCDVDEGCGHRVRVDLRNCVPLACVRLTRNECGHLVFDAWVEACGPRRLVKRNDVLYDLIRGCDLTRISAISWARWHRRDVDFDAFARFFAAGELQEGTRTHFAVRFSRPVRAETVKSDCFAMTIMFLEKEGGWREVLRVPIVHVLTNEDADGLATEAIMVVRTRWAKDAIFGSETRFDSVHGARVEIEVRGDFILDCNGQAVDANAIGLMAAPTGNGTPGGTYLSTFRVRKREVPIETTTY